MTDPNSPISDFYPGGTISVTALVAEQPGMSHMCAGSTTQVVGCSLLNYCKSRHILCCFSFLAMM